MSAVDWSQAPEGAVAHVRRVAFGALVCHWLMAKDRHWVDTNTALAPDFGLSAGVTIRPSAAEDELRARVSRLEETCAGQQIRISDLSSYLLDAEKERDQLRAEVERLKQQSQDELKVTGLLLAHLGLDDSAAFTESGVPNYGRLQAILAEKAAKGR